MELLPLYVGAATFAAGAALAIYRSARRGELGLRTLSEVEKAKLFGAPSWKLAPIPGEPEHVELEPSWVKENLVTCEIPELGELARERGWSAYKTGRVLVHRAIASDLQALFRAWKEAGLLDRIVSIDGFWNPRLVRGSTTTLSNHALGTAFDVNAASNPLGSGGAGAGEKGSTVELEEVAWKHGFTTGRGWSRPDPMHFEYARRG
jgi:hypothetical protein